MLIKYGEKGSRKISRFLCNFLPLLILFKMYPSPSKFQVLEGNLFV